MSDIGLYLAVLALAVIWAWSNHNVNEQRIELVRLVVESGGCITPALLNELETATQ